MNYDPRPEQGGDRAASRLAALSFASALVLAGCSAGIWNAGDLAQWVRDRAVEQGCERATIQLEDWYTATAEGNVWRGNCRDTQGRSKSFGINVDPVWTPSQSTN